MAYKALAERGGIAKATLHSIGSPDDYNATLATLGNRGQYCPLLIYY